MGAPAAARRPGRGAGEGRTVRTMKKILLIVGVLLVLGGGGAAAWFFYVKDMLAAEAGEEGEEPLPEEPTGPPVYVEFNPMQVPLLGETGVEQMITLVVALQVRDGSVGDNVIEMAPRLNDAFLLELYGSLERGDVMLDNGMVDLRVVKYKLLDAAADVLGEDMIDDVLVQMVSQRRG